MFREVALKTMLNKQYHTFNKWLAFLGPNPQRKCVRMAECGNSNALFIFTPTSLMTLMNSTSAFRISRSRGRYSCYENKKKMITLVKGKDRKKKG